jgi:hypothetical protein
MAATTLNKLVYELLELRRGHYTDTDSITVRMVVDWITTQRARLIKQLVVDKAFHNIDRNIIQDLGTVALEQVQANDLMITEGSPMLRTVLEIPAAIENRAGKSVLTRVGPAYKMDLPYEVINFDRSSVVGNGHFSKNSIFVFPYDNRLYLMSRTGYHLTQTYIHIQGVFQNPEEAALFANPEWTYDDSYPLNQSMVDQLKTLIIKEKLQLSMYQPQDKTDDGSDNPQINVQEQKK